MSTWSTTAKRIVRVGACAILGACSSSESVEEPAPTVAPPPPITVRACGSTTLGDQVVPTLWEQFVMRPTGPDAAPGVSLVAEGAHAGVPVVLDVASTSSEEGLTALRNGDCDLAMYSGAWTDEEGITATKVGRDAILVMTSPDTKRVAEVSRTQLAAWYSGGKRPKGLQVIGQPATHGTHAAFAEWLGLEELVVDATSEDVPGQDGAWIWFESAQRLVDQTGFRPVAIQGDDGQPYVAALDTLAADQYPLVRDLTLLTREGGAEAELARAFVELATSPAAASVFEAHYMLHPTRSASAAPVSGRCDAPALIEGTRVGWVGFATGETTTAADRRTMRRALHSSAKRAYAGGGELVVVAYASDREGSCTVAAERGAWVAEQLDKAVTERAKSAPWGAPMPTVRTVVSGPTRFWGVRAEDNQQALIVLVPPQP